MGNRVHTQSKIFRQRVDKACGMLRFRLEEFLETQRYTPYLISLTRPWEPQFQGNGCIHWTSMNESYDKRYLYVRMDVAKKNLSI